MAAGVPTIPLHSCVLPDEQAALYCGWAEAALRCARSCPCTGCAAVATHAVAAGQAHVAALLASPHLADPAPSPVFQIVGAGALPEGARPDQRVRAAGGRQGLWRLSAGVLHVPLARLAAAPRALPWLSPAALPVRPLQVQERVARMGAAMARLVHCKAALLLRTDVRQSATRAGIWRAQQCLQVRACRVPLWRSHVLRRACRRAAHPITAAAPPPLAAPQEWERLRALGMTAGLGESETLDLDCLEAWCRSAAADMLLLEALRGAPLAPLQPLSEVLPQAVAFDVATGTPSLLRPLGRDVVTQLVAALAAAKPHASEHIVRVAEAVAGSLQAEIRAGDRLRELLQPRRYGARGGGRTRLGGPGGLSLHLAANHALARSLVLPLPPACSGGMGLEELADAIRAAEAYPSLAAEVEAARGLKERWIKRAEAQVRAGGCCGSGVPLLRMAGTAQAPTRAPSLAAACPPAALQAHFDAAVERLSGPAAGDLLKRRPGAAPAVDAGTCPACQPGRPPALDRRAVPAAAQRGAMPCPAHRLPGPACRRVLGGAEPAGARAGGCYGGGAAGQHRCG